MDVPSAAHEVAVAGLLEQAPDWLDMLIRKLHRSDKRAVFMTCRQLARHVMQSSEKVHLSLDSTCSESAVHVRRQLITQLMDVGSSFEVHLSAPGTHPFPVALVDKVERMSLHCSLPSVITSFEWRDLLNLKQLEWSGYGFNQALEGLCDALDQGHLQKLTHVGFKFPVTPLGMYKPLYTRLAMALGQQVTHLDTTNVMLMLQVAQFCKLTSLELSLRLPYLQYVPEVLSALGNTSSQLVLRLEQGSYGDHFNICGRAADAEARGRGGNQWVIPEFRSYEWLTYLPLSEAQVVEFQGLRDIRVPDVRALAEALEMYGDKIICTPDPESGLTLHGLLHNSVLLQLIARVKDAPTLNVGPRVTSDLLPAVWNVLPACVEHVQFKSHSCKGWKCIWCDMPSTVTKVTLLECTVAGDELCDLVGSAPAHVGSLCIVPSYGDKVMTGLELKKHAPPHLSIVIE